MMTLTCCLESAGVSYAASIGCPHMELAKPLEEVDQSLIMTPLLGDGEKCLKREGLENETLPSLGSFSHLKLVEQELCVNFPR